MESQLLRGGDTMSHYFRRRSEVSGTGSVHRYCCREHKRRHHVRSFGSLLLLIPSDVDTGSLGIGVVDTCSWASPPV